jgi:hypothetical protein
LIAPGGSWQFSEKGTFPFSSKSSIVKFTGVLPTFAAMHSKVFPGCIGGVDKTFSSSAAAAGKLNIATQGRAQLEKELLDFSRFPPL